MRFLIEGRVSDYLSALKNKVQATYDYYTGKRTNKLGNLQDATAAEIKTNDVLLKLCQAFNRANAPYDVQVDRTSKKFLMKFDASQTPKGLVDDFDANKNGKYAKYIDSYDGKSGMVDLIFDAEDLPDSKHTANIGDETTSDAKNDQGTKGVLGKNANKGRTRRESIKNLKESLNTNQYEEITSKTVTDSDGFVTDYTMYKDIVNNQYVFVFGDKESYTPDDGNFDWTCDTEKEAYEWFNSYNEDTSLYENKKLSESFIFVPDAQEASDIIDVLGFNGALEVEYDTERGPAIVGDNATLSQFIKEYNNQIGEFDFKIEESIWQDDNGDFHIEVGDDLKNPDLYKDNKEKELEEDTPQIGEPDQAPNSVSVVDLIKSAYDKGLFNNLKCVGRENSCDIDISGVDKDRLISFFDSKKEFNREDHNESEVNSVEFISDKFDIEIFDSFMRVYKIPQDESLKESSDINDKDLEVIKVIDDVNQELGKLDKEEISKRLKDQGISVADSYLDDMLKKSQEMIDKGIGESKKITESIDINKEDILSAVIEHYGVTEEPYEGPSFILPNGDFLDIRACSNHADVEYWLDQKGLSRYEEYTKRSGSPTLKSIGCIRIDTPKYYIQLPEDNITTSQYSSLKSWIDLLMTLNVPFLEVVAPGTHPVRYYFTDEDIDPEYIVNRVRRYYISGNLYEAHDDTADLPGKKIDEDCATQSSSVGSYKRSSIDMIPSVDDIEVPKTMNEILK